MAIIKIDGVDYGDVVKLNGVAKANCAKLNGVEGTIVATLWVSVHADTIVASATNDLTSWTAYDAITGSAPSAAVDSIYVAYGKDGNGAGRWVQSHHADNAELTFTNDPENNTDPGWHRVFEQNGEGTGAAGDTIPNRMLAIGWGNDVWLAIGNQDSGTESILRSVDGNSWAVIDLSGLSGITSTSCFGLATNGTGHWWFSQQNRIYKSTNDGASWALHHTLADSANNDPGDIRALLYTNNTLVAYVRGGGGQLFAAAASDTTDWSNETDMTSGGNINQQNRWAAAAGRVVAVYAQRKWTFDVSGKSITLDEDYIDLTSDTHGNANGIATDGTTWVVGCMTGDMLTSTNGGDSWALAEANVGAEDVEMLAGNVILPI